MYDAILMQVLHHIGHFLHHRPRFALRKELLPEILNSVMLSCDDEIKIGVIALLSSLSLLSLLLLLSLL